MKTEGLLANTQTIQANSDSTSRDASVAKRIEAYAQLQSNCITMFGRKTPTGSMRKAIVRCVTGTIDALRS